MALSAHVDMNGIQISNISSLRNGFIININCLFCSGKGLKAQNMKDDGDQEVEVHIGEKKDEKEGTVGTEIEIIKTETGIEIGIEIETGKGTEKNIETVVEKDTGDDIKCNKNSLNSADGDEFLEFMLEML